MPSVTKTTKLSSRDVDALSAAVKAVGTPLFPATLSNLCMGLTQADCAHLSAFFADTRPVEIFSNRSEPEAIEALKTYFDVAYVLDPFFQLFPTVKADRVDRLRDIAPDDFRRSEYYRTFFRALQISDECGVMLVIAPDAALFLSLGMTSGHSLKPGPLQAMLPVIGALARRHWTVLTPERPDGTGRLAAQMEQAFAAFGDSKLSPREAEITRMILQGYSTKAIARDLNNSPETIKVHRKRIFAKLGLATQGALLPLFLDALRAMPPGAKGDPLVFLPKQ